MPEEHQVAVSGDVSFDSEVLTIPATSALMFIRYQYSQSVAPTPSRKMPYSWLK
jgi:hypothetical protein